MIRILVSSKNDNHFFHRYCLCKGERFFFHLSSYFSLVWALEAIRLKLVSMTVIFGRSCCCSCRRIGIGSYSVKVKSWMSLLSIEGSLPFQCRNAHTRSPTTRSIQSSNVSLLARLDSKSVVIGWRPFPTRQGDGDSVISSAHFVTPPHQETDVMLSYYPPPIARSDVKDTPFYYRLRGDDVASARRRTVPSRVASH